MADSDKRRVLKTAVNKWLDEADLVFPPAGEAQKGAALLDPEQSCSLLFQVNNPKSAEAIALARIFEVVLPNTNNPIRFRVFARETKKAKTVTDPKQLGFGDKRIKPGGEETKPKK